MSGAHGRGALAVTFAAVVLAAAAPVARAYGPADLMGGLTQLDALVLGRSGLSPAERQAVHAGKAALVAAAYTGPVSGVTYADVIGGLDCVDTDLQLARGAQGRGAQGAWAAKALGCERSLAATLKAGGQAPPRALSDLASIGAAITDIAAQIRKGKSYGLRSTAVRRQSATVVAHDLGGSTLVYGVAFSEHFRDLECVDVKVEAGRVSGASACLHRLRRLVGHANGG